MPKQTLPPSIPETIQDAVEGYFAPTMTDAKELIAHRGFRWWSVTEIQASSEQFAPREIGYRLAELVANGPCGEPVDVGV